MRVVIVWLITLSLVSLILGGGGGFIIIFVTFGIFWTLPALAVLTTVSFVEKKLLSKQRRLLAYLVGPAVGTVFPIGLYFLAPNKQNVLEGLKTIAPICVGGGLLWTFTTVLFTAPAEHQNDVAAPDAR